ncbi:MAG: hypothetical protein R8G66_20500 [Cytophagales bacterium]|nr:hypothetical protein [Cytophagales bacterium]
MNWRSLFFLITLSACASTVWKNDPEIPNTRYKDQLINYKSLNEEVINILKNYISEQLRELIDHSNNASNETYAKSLRYYSREKVKTILNVEEDQPESEKVDQIINQVRRSSFEQFLIESPEMGNDSALYSNILLEGKSFLKARIKPTLKPFTPDTVRVWEVDFMYLGKEEY